MACVFAKVIPSNFGRDEASLRKERGELRSWDFPLTFGHCYDILRLSGRCRSVPGRQQDRFIDMKRTFLL